MSGYLYSIIVLAVITGILRSVSSDMRSGIKKYVTFLSSLVMVTVIILPFGKITMGITDLRNAISDIYEGILSSNHINNSNSIIIDTGKDKISEGIKEALISKFNFDKKDVYVTVNTDETHINAVKILSVDIVLTNKASWSNVTQVKEYTENLIGVTANVTRK